MSPKIVQEASVLYILNFKRNPCILNCLDSPKATKRLPRFVWCTDFETFQGGGSDVVSVRCFGVRFSVMFHFMFVHYTFSSVWVAEWPSFGK